MATVGTHARKGGKRGRVSGWSPGAARRNTAFLRSVDEHTLDGVGLALTLTLRTCPPTREVWAKMVDTWIKRQKRAGLIRLHWVMEFQRRGVPHLHVAAWYGAKKIAAVDGPTSALTEPAMIHQDMRRASLEHQNAARKAVSDWLEVGEICEPGPKGQQVRPIEGPVGWFMYLAKHCGRGRKHYQRQQESQPEGWEGSPRVWGHSGPWTLIEPVSVAMTDRQWFQLRRLVRSWRVANARAGVPGPGWSWISGGLFNRDHLRAAALGKGRPLRAKLRNLQHARGMLRCTDRKLSEVRGISEWIDQDMQRQLCEAIGVEHPGDGPRRTVG